MLVYEIILISTRGCKEMGLIRHVLRESVAEQSSICTKGICNICRNITNQRGCNVNSIGVGLLSSIVLSDDITLRRKNIFMEELFYR